MVSLYLDCGCVILTDGSRAPGARHARPRRPVSRTARGAGSAAVSSALESPAPDLTPRGSQFSSFPSCRWYTIPPLRSPTFSPPLTMNTSRIAGKTPRYYEATDSDHPAL